MSFANKFNSPHLKKPARRAVYEEYVERARACLLWNMSPEYYDSMSDLEYEAFVEAWNDIQKERAHA